MSFFSGSKLRRLRESKRMSITDVFRATGVSRAQISRIENNKSDPRMSTVTQLLTCYGASLGDLESSPPTEISLSEVRNRAHRAAEDLLRVGLGPSDPQQRLARKARREEDRELGDRAFGTRG